MIMLVYNICHHLTYNYNSTEYIKFFNSQRHSNWLIFWLNALN